MTNFAVILDSVVEHMSKTEGSDEIDYREKNTDDSDVCMCMRVFICYAIGGGKKEKFYCDA